MPWATALGTTPSGGLCFLVRGAFDRSGTRRTVGPTVDTKNAPLGSSIVDAKLSRENADVDTSSAAEDAVVLSPVVPFIARHFHEHGEWPNPDWLQRSLARQDIDIDVFHDIHVAGRGLAFVNSNAVCLTPRALAASGEAVGELADLLAAVKVFCRAYLSEENEARITERELAAELKLDDARSLRLRLLLDSFGYVTAGGATDETGTWWRVGAGTRHFLKVETVADLIDVVDRLDRPAVPPLAAPRPRTRFPVAVPAVSDPGMLHLDDLHPAIGDAVRDLLGSAPPSIVVSAAARALTAVLRDKTGERSDGTALVDSAFAHLTVDPQVTGLSERSAESLHDGVKWLARGVMRALRNTSTHEVLDLNETETLEALAVVSYVARQVDRMAAATG